MNAERDINDWLIENLLKVTHAQQALIIKMNDREIFPNTPEFFKHKTRIDSFQRVVDIILGEESPS